MPTVRTIKPAGGGDYTSLQTWEDWADDQATADQWAECYDGGDLGQVKFATWSSTPDATNYPRVYTPIAERHLGKDDGVEEAGTGAFIAQDSSLVGVDNASLRFLRIEGLRIEMVAGASTVSPMLRCLGGATGEGVIIDSNLFLFRLATANGAIACIQAQNQTGSGKLTIQNNICVCDTGTGFKMGYGIWFLNGAVDVDVFSNTMIKGLNSGMNIDMADGSNTSTLENNISMGNKFEWRRFASATLISNNNMSSDASADDQGGTGHLINKTATNQFVDYNTDWNLKIGSDALLNGKTLGSFDWDALHEDADNWRPRNGAWDMGALEVSLPTVRTIKPAGGGDYTSLQTWEDWADDQATAFLWAECYAGGDLGELSISAAWAATASEELYPRIYTPLSERHLGKDDGIGVAGTGAYINMDGSSISAFDNLGMNFVRFEGIRCERTGSGGANLHIIKCIGAITGRDTIIDGNLCLWRHSSDGTGACIYFISQTGASKSIIRNNICVCSTVIGKEIDYGIRFIGNINVDILSNTVTKADVHGIEVNHAFNSKTSTIENNISMGSTTNDFKWTDAGNATRISNNNLSEDATADDQGGTGHLINKTTTDQFVDYNTDWNLKAGADALENGKTLGSFSVDALGLSRPQNDFWDIGALEKALSGVVPGKLLMSAV